MQVVAGITLRSLNPRVWDANSEYYLSDLEAIIISYADFHQQAKARKQAMEQGLHTYLDIPPQVQIYLDNGAFYFLKHNGEIPISEYIEFVELAHPNWYPVPRDFIPTPSMPQVEQSECFERTMESNNAFAHGNYVPIVHISPKLNDYTVALGQNPLLLAKSQLAIGGIVPNLLRSPAAIPHQQIINSLQSVRSQFSRQRLHVFGVGGTATLHLARLLGIDSADSSGWRNRAARGIVQLAGRGDRTVANLGSWRGRSPSSDEWHLLEECLCPACQKYGLAGLKADKVVGFRHRATHNLWVLLQEAWWIQNELTNCTYQDNYQSRLDNSHYLPLIRQIVSNRALC